MCNVLYMYHVDQMNTVWRFEELQIEPLRNQRVLYSLAVFATN